jgi:hypothetical protein
MDDPGRLERQEVEAFLETRRELGPTYEPEVVDALAERLEQVVEARVAAASSTGVDRARLAAEAGKRQFVLAIVSLGAGIPITAIAGGVADVPGILLSWLGIAAVNAAHAAAVNGPRRDPSVR